MNKSKEPNALWLADIYKTNAYLLYFSLHGWAEQAAYELVRLHAENEALRKRIDDVSIKERTCGSA
jgi:hypothetical protein